MYGGTTLPSRSGRFGNAGRERRRSFVAAGAASAYPVLVATPTVTEQLSDQRVAERRIIFGPIAEALPALALTGPVAVLGTPFKVAVTAYSDAKGTPSKAVGATVSGGGTQAKTAANGTAKLSFTQAGRFTLKVGAPHAVRTETRVCVETAAARTCG